MENKKDSEKDPKVEKKPTIRLLPKVQHLNMTMEEYIASAKKHYQENKARAEQEKEDSKT